MPLGIRNAVARLTLAAQASPRSGYARTAPTKTSTKSLHETAKCWTVGVNLLLAIATYTFLPY
jgi:hypothetical protein